MKNAELNKIFLSSLSNDMLMVVLKNISNHYSISLIDVKNELFDEEAENVMDYITGNERAAISVVYQKNMFSYLNK